MLPNLVLPIEDRDHHLGPVTARFTLVEYGDFECPHCAHLEPIIHEVLREMGDDLCFIYRHYPQPTIHPHSTLAAEASEAAEMQAKFWLMHDRLFAHQDSLSERFIRRLAEELPIEMAAYDRDMRSGAPRRRVAEDLETGRDAGVADTPTLFVNGRMHVGSYEFLPLLEALRAGP
jgi:protein-disulfide isomerase